MSIAHVMPFALLTFPESNFKALNRAKIYLSAVLIVVTASGMFASVLHYHSQSMECLYHAEGEQHFTENHLLCPICAYVADEPPIQNVEAVLPGYEDVKPGFLSTFIYIGSKAGLSQRAPPSQI